MAVPAARATAETSAAEVMGRAAEVMAELGAARVAKVLKVAARVAKALKVEAPAGRGPKVAAVAKAVFCLPAAMASSILVRIVTTATSGNSIVA